MSAPMKELLDDLENVMSKMSQHRISRLQIPVSEASFPIVVEMSPDAWKEEIAPAEPPPQATPAVTVKEMLVGVQGELCACGHDLDTEHTDAGCLHGCADELCSPRDDAEPES
jgi:hypothetical protein